MATTKPKPKSDRPRKVPERRCVGCGGTFEKRDLLRIVRAPEPKPVDTPTTDAPQPDRISIDFSGKRAGRGAYICKKEECLAKAKKSGRLKSSLECEISDAVYEQLAREIRLEEQLLAQGN